MTTRALFPTLIYTARLARRGERAFNAQLLRECRQLRADDAAGRRWSARNYPHGYTSYGSAYRMQRASPTFAALEAKLRRHVHAFGQALGLDFATRPVAMTDCWVNIMARHAVHGLHLHPLSTLSGSYYVQAPRGSAGLKLEDPRLDRLMAAAPRRDHWVVVPALSGQLVLFESWLRHEVPPHRCATERVSISFNYGWF